MSARTTEDRYPDQSLPGIRIEAFFFLNKCKVNEAVHNRMPQINARNTRSAVHYTKSARPISFKMSSFVLFLSLLAE